MIGARTEQTPFSVTSEQRGHVAHLRLAGEIDMATAPDLEGWLQAAEVNGTAAIVVDLEQVTFMDASGLRAFLGAARRADESGRTFAIARASARVLRVLQITGTTHLLAADSLAFLPARNSARHSFAAQATIEGDPHALDTRNNHRVARAAR